MMWGGGGNKKVYSDIIFNVDECLTLQQQKLGGGGLTPSPPLPFQPQDFDASACIP